jgi:hypothetical protein
MRVRRLPFLSSRILKSIREEPEEMSARSELVARLGPITGVSAAR